MKTNKNNEDKEPKKVYRSMLEIRQGFFPKAQAKKAVEDQRRDPKTCGTGLTDDIMEEFRNRLGTKLGACKG